MNKPKRPYTVSWKVKRNQMKRALAWKLRWQTQPVFMRQNLDSLIKRNTDLGKKNRETLREFMATAPRIIPIGEVRKVIKAQWLAKGYEITATQVESKRIKLWRHGLLKFDDLTLAWTNFACID